MKKYNSPVKMSEDRTLNLYYKHVELLDDHQRDLMHMPSKFFDDLKYNLERFGYEGLARHLIIMLGWD